MLLFFQPGVNVALEIFHAERFKCHSEFYFKESGIHFVNSTKKSDQKIDYFLNVDEDTQMNTTLTEVVIADAFSKGEFSPKLTPKVLFHGFMSFMSVFMNMTCVDPFKLLCYLQCLKNTKFVRIVLNHF